MTTKKRFDHPLQTLVSARVRLTDEQRSKLRAAYNKHREGLAPGAAAPVMPGSSISTSTSYSINSQLGLQDITIRDLLTTRDSIAVPVVIKLQRSLGIEVITPDEVLQAAKGYVDYIFSTDAN